MRRYDLDLSVPEVRYNRHFAVNDLAAGIAGLLQLSEIPAGDAYRKAVGRTAVEMLGRIGHVSLKEKDALIEDIYKEEK